MDTDWFDYTLPPERIAQEPPAAREDARLMILPAGGGAPRHGRITHLPGELCAGDLLVLNDTRVEPARLHGRRPTGGRVELLVLPPLPGSPPEEPVRPCLLRAGHRPRPGEQLELPGGARAEVLAHRGGGEALVRFHGPDLEALMAAHGEVPLPPYIRREPGDPRAAADRERYQTVFARRPGAVAAPTAGLHFTPDLLEAVAAHGVELAWITLHVGPGTFRPVTAERAEEHRLDPEPFILSQEVAGAVDRTRARGGRVVACGTTVVRVLEERADGAGGVRAGEGHCGLFILPGHRFQVVDGLLTNFHLPRSSLLMLVSALAGRERILAAYGEAVTAGYRFYSYGDAMLLAPGPPREVR